MTINNEIIEISENNNIEEKKSKKKERKKNAIELPNGITQDMMKKYVVYYKEIYNKEKGLSREYFKVEKHPKLNKSWISSKSNRISIFEKLKEANNVIDNLLKEY